MFNNENPSEHYFNELLVVFRTPYSNLTQMQMPLLDPPDLAEWGLHCFCIGARRTPHGAIAADNNGRILFLARDGVTVSGLASVGVPCLESQIEWLKAIGILSVTNGVLRTRFPTLGTEIIGMLRDRSRRHATSTVARISPAAAAVGDALALTGAQEHHYAVLFGHGLDGLLWHRLRLEGSMPSTELSLDSPYWNGGFWAVHPKRIGAAGTNESTRDHKTLVTVWSDASVQDLRKISRMWELGIWSERVPVICVGPDEDAIHTACGEVAQVVAEALKILVGELQSAGLDWVEREQLLLIAGHEFIWDIAEQLCQTGQLVQPRALRQSGTHADDLKALIYIRSV